MSIVQEFFPSQTPLFLFDASAFIYRGFYAYSSMQKKDGFPTSAIYSVARVLFKILRVEKPVYFGFILDGVGKSFRHEIFPEYKQNRTKTPEALVAQIEPICHMVSLLGIPIITSENAEADDYIASLAEQYKHDGVVIVGVDKDLRQCLADTVILWDPSTKEEKIVTQSSFIEETGLLPAQWPDFQAIIGDSSDNIPGIKGIGEKTAYKIFEHYKTLEDIEAHLDTFDAKIQKKLLPEIQNAYVYRELTRLSKTCCILDKDALRIQQPQDSLMNFIEEYELFSLRRDVVSLYKSYGMDISRQQGDRKEHIREAQAEKKRSSISSGEEQGDLFSSSLLTHTENSIDGIVCSMSEVPRPENMIITLYMDTTTLSIYTNNTIYTILEYTEEELTSYMQSVKQCITIHSKKLCRLFPSLLALPIEWRDIAVMAYLLNPEEREYTIESIHAVWSNSLPVETKTVLDFIYQSALFFIEHLQAKALYDLYIEIEQPLCSILASMEYEGIGLDTKAVQELLVFVEQEIKKKEHDIYTMAGREFNIRSSQQLGSILFNELGLEHKSKTKTGHFSTSQESLEKLVDKNPIVSAVLEFRTLEKLRSTYLEPLPKYIDEHKRIHTTFNQLATATGRLSSSNPNLQNIPIRGVFGQPIRNCFCARKGYTLVAMDYSQIELRILAYVSQEESLMDSFARNEDIHKRTASILYGLPIEEITKEQRRNAKAINFGLLYGMGATKLAREMKSSLAQAKEFITTYFERLGKVKKLHSDIVEDVKAKGYVTTLFGRRRYLPDIQSANEQMYAQACRQAVNTVIQGTAADIIKKAMVNIWNNNVYEEMGAKLILQIHDELIIEVPEEYAQVTAEHMIVDMTNIRWKECDIPLIVDYGIATTWGQAH